MTKHNNKPSPKQQQQRQQQQQKQQQQQHQQQQQKQQSGPGPSGMGQTKTGNHDNTMISSDGEPLPKRSLRETVTDLYNKKVEATKGERVATGTLAPTRSVDFDVETLNEKLRPPTIPLKARPKHEDAPVNALNDLLPAGIKDEAGPDKVYKTGRVEFIVLERELDLEEDDPMESKGDNYEWEVSDKARFEKAMGMAIEAFTENDWDRQEILDYSAMGWNTGVGMVAFRTDDMNLVDQFRQILRTLDIPGLRYESYPRRMLLRTYGLTVYFNSAFEQINMKKLMYWLLKFNPTLQGEIELVEVWKYPASHKNTKRAGAKIVAFEGSQAFLDSLQAHPKDFPFSVRFGGNLYIRGVRDWTQKTPQPFSQADRGSRGTP